MAPVQIIKVNNDYSDGDASHRPGDASWTIIDPPTIYLEKPATRWLQAQGKPIQKGVIYRLNQLPDGYALFEKLRQTGIAGTKLSDKRLFGNPNQKYFDSPNRFFPHFLHMMEGKDMSSCPCTVCGASGSGPALPMRGVGNTHTGPSKPGRKPGVKLSLNPSKPVEPAVPAHQDEDRVPDMLRILIDRLKRQGRLETNFKEELSMDWRAERSSLPRLLDALPKHASFVPRVGELVLFVRFLDDNQEICLEHASGHYKTFDKTKQEFQGFPKWEAGVVAQNAPVQLEDILSQSNKNKNSTLTGFRVEPLPKPGSMDKNASKQYKYVPLHWTRPLVFWREFIEGMPEWKWHPTIHNALTAMSSFSLMEKYSFSGTWPKAYVNCKGVYVGSELWITGDAVRILPEVEQKNVTDILHVTSIVLQLTNLDKSTDNDEDDRHPYNSAVWLYGKLYTISAERAWNAIPEPLTKEEECALPQGLHGYRLFHRHDPRKSARVPLKKVLGRCFEADSINLWFPPSSGGPSSATSLDLGLSGLHYARDFAKEHDARIMADKGLFWADNRGDALDIHELNGVRLSKYDAERDEEKLDDWATASRILSNKASKLDKYKYTEKAQNMNQDSAMGGTDEEARATVENTHPGLENPWETVMRTGSRLRQASATPSEELNDDEAQTVNAQWGIGNTKPVSSSSKHSSAAADEDERAISARFGLNGTSRKRSRSVAEIDEQAADQSADEARSEDEGVKGVSRLAAPLGKAAHNVTGALGMRKGGEHGVKKTRVVGR